ncbi:MAG: peptidase domain protein [Paenibacillaceae bacterium]|nr:peptidase domain protein [Paenibacillaceae bacterium]
MEHQTFQRDQTDRIRLHVLPSDRFKTYAISAYIGTTLTEENVTPTALTPFVLRRGTEKLPETRAFREKLDDLYGAGFGFDIYKRGDYQIAQFRMDIIEDSYVSGASGLLREGLQFLGDALTGPLLENGVFSTKYVDAEKRTLQKKIESIINDKIRYAAERCLEEMCRNEPYRFHPLGRLQAIEGLTPESLYAHYLKWLGESPIDLYVVGNTTMQEVKALVQEAFHLTGSGLAAYRSEAVHRTSVEPRTVVEQLEVSQGKLNMGLRTGTTYADPDYAALLVYNGILGGYPHSKLFTNVREKASLAYYAASRLDGHKGILTIQSGIEIANYEKAVAIIHEQLEAMRAGQISDLEYSQTLAMIRNQLKEMNDSAFELISFDFNSILTGHERTVPELIAQVEQSDSAAIQAVAGKVQLDTIYFLTSRKGE